MLKQLYKQIRFQNIYYILASLLAFFAPLSWKISRFMLFTIIGTKFLQFDLKKSISQIKESKALMVLLLFVSYQFITLLWTATSYEDSHIFTRTYILWLAIPILALSLTQKYIKHIITVFLLGMGVSEIISYGMYFGFWTIHGHGSEDPSPFMHHTSYSIFMAFTATLLLNRLFSHTYTIREKMIMGIFFLTVSGNLFISQGRIGQLALIISIILTTILHFRFTLKTVVSSLLIVFSIFFMAYKTSPMFQQRIHMASEDIEKIKQGNLYSSWGIRISFIIVGLDIMQDHPFFGIGLEDTQAIKTLYLKRNAHHFSEDIINYMHYAYHFHNQYLMTTLQGGIVGLCLFLLMFYYLFKLPIQDKELKHLSILFLTIFLVGFISDPFMMYESTRALFIIFISVFIATSLHTQRGTSCA